MTPMVGGCEARGPWFELLRLPLVCQRVTQHAGLHRAVYVLEEATGAVLTVTWGRALPQDSLPIATGQLEAVARPALAERHTESW